MVLYLEAYLSVDETSLFTKGTSRLEAATTEEWTHVNHKRTIPPDVFVFLLLWVSGPNSLWSWVDAKQFYNRTQVWRWLSVSLVTTQLFKFSFLFYGKIGPWKTSGSFNTAPVPQFGIWMRCNYRTDNQQNSSGVSMLQTKHQTVIL